jgi:hypothetical protein
MRHLLAALTAPAWGIRTLHEARQYAQHRHDLADVYRAGFDRGYQAGKQDQA